MFERKSLKHKEYKPVLDWILNGKGMIVYGGKKYEEELKGKYRRIFMQFRNSNKIVEIPAHDVDNYEDYVKKHDLVKNSSFNDAHLVAIISISRCKIICTEDVEAKELVKEKKLYPKRFEIPKIYSNESHKELLCDKNIANICQKHKKDKYGNKTEKLNKKDRNALDKVLDKSK
ncbi:hypothetical protein MBAV_005819 [Candidatus Magnetobacterium bavaricum]|uniref:PIN domain-containing protein n=1 Tax=Candidatus Magnetobacterium bavaricum TaxID=29290 RepID=A0A0F3GMT1_9BACT|nr:hypothetical protein MBAV_005819 [Candidatus Magnetobacterium bavaricum]